MAHDLDEPFALPKSQRTHALARLRDLAYGRTSPNPATTSFTPART